MSACVPGYLCSTLCLSTNDAPFSKVVWICSCDPIPGTGDHESVLIEFLLMAKYIPPAQHIIYLWCKANYTHLSSIIADFSRFLFHS